MEQIPTLDVRVRDFGQQLSGLLTRHEREISECLTRGVEQAMRGIGPTIVDEACTLAIQKIHEDVKHYLLYGEGGQAIRAAVHHALEPLTAMLRATAGEEYADGGGVTESSVP